MGPVSAFVNTRAGASGQRYFVSRSALRMTDAKRSLARRMRNAYGVSNLR